jgi:hypothetical protein
MSEENEEMFTTTSELPPLDWSDFHKAQHNDVEAFFNLREWVASALKAKGAVMTGYGMGMGCADLWFNLDGAEFFLTVKPVMK